VFSRLVSVAVLCCVFRALSCVQETDEKSSTNSSLVDLASSSPHRRHQSNTSPVSCICSLNYYTKIIH